ncbi:MAG: T9SS type A sorting domain-containing protein [Bacteroidetes bacterium]|nr:T9SS type A sorting domain-containing protein [Bacteroidota bacterium]
MVLGIAPEWEFLRQESPPIDILPGHLHRYSLELTSHVPGRNAVYLLRRFEFVAAPHDRFGTILTDRSYPTRIEFGYRSDLHLYHPGLTIDIDSVQHLTGMQGFYASMRVQRDTARGDTLQWLALHSVEDTSIVTPRLAIEVLHHPPAAVVLHEPADSALVRVYFPTDTTTFTWERAEPPDPFHNIRVSRFDTLLYSDYVRDVLILIDAGTLIRSVKIDSDDHGRSSQRRMSHKELAKALLQIIYPHRRLGDIIWYVESSDGLYVTSSTEMPDGRPGHLLMTDRVINVEQVSPVADFHLGQNYPNPAAGATTIPFGINEGGVVRLTVHTLLGERVAVLVDERMEAGEYRIPFETFALPPGTYICRLETSSGLLTMVMSLLR